jgi:hypothetical protein
MQQAQYGVAELRKRAGRKRADETAPLVDRRDALGQIRFIGDFPGELHDMDAQTFRRIETRLDRPHVGDPDGRGKPGFRHGRIRWDCRPEDCASLVRFPWRIHQRALPIPDDPDVQIQEIVVDPQPFSHLSDQFVPHAPDGKLAGRKIEG